MIIVQTDAPGALNPQDPKLLKDRFVVQSDITTGVLFAKVRQEFEPKIGSRDGLFFSVGRGRQHTLLACNAFMDNVYARYKEEDGLLYIHCSRENTFG